MANYIKESLEEGENIVLKGRLHWTSIWRYYFWSIFFIFAAIACVFLPNIYPKYSPIFYWGIGVCIVFSLIIYLIGRLFRTRSEFAVTTNRFIQKDGIFNIKMTEIPLYKVETVNFYQTIWQRMVGTGCVELVGSGGTSHQVHFIEHPMLVRKTIVAAIGNSNTSSIEKTEETCVE